jgi:hypothetical protein
MFGCRALASITVRYELAALGASMQHKILITSDIHRPRAEQNGALSLDTPARRNAGTLLSHEKHSRDFLY